jgi:2-succinyl-5-enolpyruvyl-6-hydroxy-3-cyclohexene-1-carboxylate synthase
MSANGISATKLARQTIRELLELGICDFIISPGSRNAPLTMALYEAAERGLADLHVRLDERGAAFYALGVAKASKNYAVVICTSGTAVANYHPAALEAFHADVNLLFLTADRPARLRNTGANQTTLQDGILAPLQTIDTAAPIELAEILIGGPVHLNLQFDEPLIEDNSITGPDWLAGFSLKRLIDDEDVKESIEVSATGVLVVGHDRGGFSIEAINEFADILDWPVIAEDPLSIPSATPHASIFLADSSIREALSTKEVIVIGRTTLSRSINAFISEAERVVVIDPRIEYVDIDRSADLLLTNIPHITKHATPQEWDQLWIDASVAAAREIELSHSWSEQIALRTITAHIPSESALFIGSSRPIRDIEALSSYGNDISTFANRGLAGIDGNIATAFGIASRFERSFAILGDLTFLHDLSALANPVTDNLTLFIIDNNGGGIFSTLPQAGVEGFETIFGTPHDLDIEKIIAGFGYSVQKAKSEADLMQVIAHHSEGLHFVIVEVPSRSANAITLKDLYQRVARAVRIGINFA